MRTKNQPFLYLDSAIWVATFPSLSLLSTFPTLGPVFRHKNVCLFWTTKPILKIQTDLCSAQKVLSENMNYFSIWLSGVFKKKSCGIASLMFLNAFYRMLVTLQPHRPAPQLVKQRCPANPINCHPRHPPCNCCSTTQNAWCSNSSTLTAPLTCPLFVDHHWLWRTAAMTPAERENANCLT